MELKDIEYFSNDGTLHGLINEMKQESDIEIPEFTGPNYSEVSEYNNTITQFRTNCIEKIEELKDSINLLDTDRENFYNEYVATENSVIELGQTIKLEEGTDLYYTSRTALESSNPTGYIGNESTSEDDEYVVKYVAIYDENGILVDNISIDDGVTVDERIEQLKKEGKLKEDADITLLPGAGRKESDGSVSDIGWLEEVKYEKTKVEEQTATVTERKNEKTLTEQVQEVKDKIEEEKPLTEKVQEAKDKIEEEKPLTEKVQEVKDKIQDENTLTMDKKVRESIEEKIQDEAYTEERVQNLIDKLQNKDTITEQEVQEAIDKIQNKSTLTDKQAEEAIYRIKFIYKTKKSQKEINEMFGGPIASL